MNSLSPTPIQDEFPPAPIVVSAAIPSVGSERTELSEESDAEQYLRDLAAVDGDPCFFTAMGERARERLGL